MLKDKFGPWVLIIGGSEGIGRSMAVRLAKEGLNIALVARKRKVLDEAAATVRAAAKVDVRTLSQDMTAPDMMEHIKAFTRDVTIGLLIYNAGAMDRFTTFLGDNIEGHLHTIRRNCEGPTRLCHHFGGLMREHRRGGIVLMSSVSGLAGSYGVPVYGGSKAFDMIFGEGLWSEFRDFGVSVLSAVVGSVATPANERMFLGKMPEGAANADDIAKEVLDNIENGPTLFLSNAKPMLSFLRNEDRRAAVSQLAEATKAFFARDVNRKPYDPKAVVK
jgi:short-subunit dehydrogenase